MNSSAWEDPDSEPERVEILAVHLADLADPADRRGTDPDEDDTVISRRGAWREPGIIARD